MQRLKSNLKIGSSELDVLKSLDLHEGVVAHLDRMKVMRDSLAWEELDSKVKKVGNLKPKL